MIESKELIDEVIQDRTEIKVSVRSIACKTDEFSSFISFNEDAEKLLYNSKLIDGVRLKIKNFILKLNKRHNF